VGGCNKSSFGELLSNGGYGSEKKIPPSGNNGGNGSCININSCSFNILVLDNDWICFFILVFLVLDDDWSGEKSCKDCHSNSLSEKKGRRKEGDTNSNCWNDKAGDAHFCPKMIL